MCEDFITFDKRGFDLIYSRFTFHSITNNDYENFWNSIQPGSYIAIEARSIKGESDYVYHGKNIIVTILKKNIWST